MGKFSKPLNLGVGFSEIQYANNTGVEGFLILSVLQLNLRFGGGTSGQYFFHKRVCISGVTAGLHTVVEIGKCSDLTRNKKQFSKAMVAADYKQFRTY